MAGLLAIAGIIYAMADLSLIRSCRAKGPARPRRHLRDLRDRRCHFFPDTAPIFVDAMHAAKTWMPTFVRMTRDGAFARIRQIRYRSLYRFKNCRTRSVRGAVNS